MYTGKALKPSVVVKYNGATLKKKRDYTVSYSNNINVGTATATIVGKGEYAGKKKVRFTISPRAVKLGKLAAGKGQFTATWTPLTAQVDGYEIEYGLKKDCSDGTTVTVDSGDTATMTVVGLNAKTKYYARIRAYRRIGKKTYFSAWSKARGVRIK